jgi:hypothetical protein
MFCEGEVDGQRCDWPLSSLPLRQPGWRPAAAAAPPGAVARVLSCPNGHAVEPGDLICSDCGADIAADASAPDEAASNDLEPAGDPEAQGETRIGEWRLLKRLPTTSHVRERYEAIRDSDGREAVLTLYSEGSEPDPEVYEVLRTLERDHVPEVLETGYFGERAYEIAEDLRGGSLADVGLLPDDPETLSRVVQEVGGALAALAEVGLRHRDLRPGAIMVRARDPLDLVITGFGSARLSDYDLDIVSPLEITRYTAPEAVAGGVAAASDWWSLGMLLLEQVTHGACFAGADDQAFLISVLTNGPQIPEGLGAELDSLLRGLLAVDRRSRWCWPEVRRWLDGDIPKAPPRQGPAEEDRARRSIELGGKRHKSCAQFALAAAEADHWDEARGLFLRGDLATWMEESGLHAQLRSEIRAIAALDNVSEDFRLALALKVLNPAMPLVVRGEIVTPGWLVEHPDEGYELVTGPVPDRLERDDSELWLARLKRRELRVRERARHLQVELDETKVRTLALSTSKSRLAGIWEEQRRLLPDTDHPGLLAIIERKVSEEEDLILLLSAATAQFRTAEAIVEEALRAAERAGLDRFDRDAAVARLSSSRRELNEAIEARLEGFARSGYDRIDEWADQFRLERRLPIDRALALLAVPEDRWKQPPRQDYVATLLDFFARRITGSLMRGPLTRMVIGKTTPRIDMMELGSPRRSAEALLNHLLLRNEQSIDIDPAPLSERPEVERRLRTLYQHANLYRRDTGIDGLYLGFPFFVMQEAGTSRVPRIAPVLLWPVKVNPEVGSRGRISLAFDRGREEVRLNPAFQTMLGIEAAKRWEEVANSVLGRSSVNAAEVVEAFRELATTEGSELGALPPKELRLPAGEDRVSCSAVLFHLSFLGQAVMEDLRQLKSKPPQGSSLEAAFRVGEELHHPERVTVAEAQRYFTADSDPSQETAVLEVRGGRGLLVEGPPGTGKSQTIVNMVADAIGVGRSLLVVCQKQAALEVVHKRLDKAGLGERVIMVNDVNKDREAVIRTIRGQLEDLHGRSNAATAWRQQRAQTAARIEELERALDGHHQAIHAADKQTGLSYRLILGDLIALARQGHTVSLPSLRHLLSTLDPGRLSVLEDKCAPVARLWLPAHFEGSALEATRPFGTDEGTIETFGNDIAAFIRVEGERQLVNERTPNAMTIDDPEPYRNWSSANGGVLRKLDDPDRRRLARWLELFAGASQRTRGSTAVQQDLKRIEADLLLLPPDEADGAAVAVALPLAEEELSSWTALSDRLLRRPTFLERLSPIRWLAAWRLTRFLSREGLDDPVEFGAALHREERLRPTRNRLIGLVTRIGEPAGHLAPLRTNELLAEARQVLADLDSAESLVARLEAYPEPDTAFAMARAATGQAVEDLIEGIDQGLARHAARTASLGALRRLDPWMSEEWSEACSVAIHADRSNSVRLAPLEGDLAHIAAFQRFRARVAHLGEEAMAVFTELARVRTQLETLPEDELDPAIRRIMATEARLAWKQRLEANDPLLLLEAAELEAKAASLAAADKEMRSLNRRQLLEGVDLARLRPLREWEDITRLRGVRAKRLREFVDKGADLGLMQLRPVWLVNPDVASRLLPLRKALFETVIFDEASQMPIEYALPTLYRSAAMVVSGDEKQMPPTSFFASRIESDEAEIYDGRESGDEIGEAEREAIEETWNRREIKDCPDLLQLAKTVLPPSTLQIHYRSAYRELIQFSNAAFYANRLSVPARHPADEVRKVRPIEMIRVDGTYEDQTNPEEADAVADELAKLWREAGDKPPTVGVVTFNRKQADLIEEVLENKAEEDPGFRAALTKERDRIEDGEDMGFFVKNVENVQGDERDVIIFSSTFGKNAQGTFRRYFGVLGQQGGERRLNVAVTRARRKVILVTSMPIPLISDFLSTRRQAASPRDFLQAYFEYARLISDGDLDGAEALLTRLTPEQRRGSSHDTTLGDGLESAVGDEIRALGWEPSSVADEGAFGLDFAIEDPRSGLFGIGIECDAPRHSLLERARAREIWRPAILRRSIPAIHRISSHRWFNEPEKERERLRAAIRAAMGATG